MPRITTETSKSRDNRPHKPEPARRGKQPSTITVPAPEPEPEALVTVSRTMDVIEMLGDKVEGLSLSAVARALGVNRSIAFRILHTLRTKGYLYQDPDTESFKLTFRISNIGLRQQTATKLTDLCYPLLRALAEETGELVRLAVIENNKPVWVHSAVGSARLLRLDPTWTTDVILHVHAVGKAYLSTLDDEEIIAQVGQGPFERHTSRSMGDLKSLLKDVAESRNRGFAMNCEESEVGVGAIAAPVCTQLREVRRCVGVVSIAAPISRISCADLAKRGPRLMEVCGNLAKGWPLSLPSDALAVNSARYP